MTIKLILNNISKEEIENIIEYYNTIKPPNFGKLDTFVCKEGGFQIKPNLVTNNNLFIGNFLEENKKNRQLRFNRRYLVSYCNIPSFYKEEEYLLYKSMQFVLGKENISYYESYSSALLDSPNIKIKNSPLLQNKKCSPIQNKYNFRRILPI